MLNNYRKINKNEAKENTGKLLLMIIMMRISRSETLNDYM